MNETANQNLVPQSVRNALDAINGYNAQYAKPYQSNEIVQKELDQNKPDSDEAYPQTWQRNQLNTNLLDEILVKGSK